jgi:predicted MFS family arabinose efflux permease
MSRNYKLLWTSFLVSNLGDWTRKIALPVIILEKTGSPYHMASLYGVSFLPWVVFSLFGGVIADRFSKTKIVACGHFISLIFLFLLIREIGQASVNMALVYIVTFLLSSVEPLVHPSFQSLLPQLVEARDLPRANAALQTVDNTLSLIGPMAGGSLLLILSGEHSLWINAVSFLFAGIIILFIGEARPSAASGSGELRLWRDTAEGLRYTWNNKTVLSGSILFLFTNFGIHLFQANFLFFVTDILRYSPFEYGVVLSVSGFGALIGALIAPRLNKLYQAGAIISVSTVFAGISTILLFRAQNLWYIACMMCVATMFGNVNVISYFSLRQRVVEQRVLGRVVSATRMISYLSIPVGAFLGGVMLEKGWSIYTIVLLAGFIRLAAGIFGYLSPLRERRQSA